MNRPMRQTSKVWDFDENEGAGNVVFLDGPQRGHIPWPTVSSTGSRQQYNHKHQYSCSCHNMAFEAQNGSFASTQSSTESSKVRKLFVSNVPYRVTDYRLKQFFSKFGKVINAHVKKEPNQRRETRYGFVTFHKPQDAWTALNADSRNLVLCGFHLIINKAYSCHQPIELPDGTVEWLPGKFFYKDSGELVENEVGTKKKHQVEVRPVSVEPDAIEVCKETENEEDGHYYEVNDDCLLHIFSFLPLTDLIRVERVCKQWQAVGRSIWRRMHNLDMRLVSVPANQLQSMGVLKSILMRCGDSLTSLSLTVYAHSRHRRSKILSIVSDLCPNLEELDAAGVKLNRPDLRNLGLRCSKLRKINLDYCSGIHEIVLDSLFRSLPVLECLSLVGWSQLTGRALRQLPPFTMRQLNLNFCNHLLPSQLIVALKELTNLEHLSIASCTRFTDGQLENLCRTAPQLRSLNMAQYFPHLNSLSLHFISKLTGLRVLNLELNDLLTDKVLDAIVRECKELENLNINGCQGYGKDEFLTSAGIKTLAELPNLKELHMSYLADIEDNALLPIAQNGILRKLVCRGCPSLKGEGFARIITLCPELELCDLSGCDSVRISVVKTAITSLKVRNNNKPLRLIVGGTNIHFDQLDNMAKEIPPQLSVDMADLSITHLRPDFVDDIYFNEQSDVSNVDELNFFEDMCDMDILNCFWDVYM